MSFLDSIKPLSVNQRYKALLRDTDLDDMYRNRQGKPKGRLVDDYNKYVDEVLKLTPHNQANAKKSVIKENTITMQTKEQTKLQMPSTVQAPATLYSQQNLFPITSWLPSQEEHKHNVFRVIPGYHSNRERTGNLPLVLPKPDNFNKGLLSSKPMMQEGLMMNNGKLKAISSFFQVSPQNKKTDDINDDLVLKFKGNESDKIEGKKCL